jgi:uncharacterized protein (TIGR02611 family)
MFAALREDWSRLERGTPGHRFQAVHDARRRRQENGWSRPLWLVAGVVLVALGPVAGVIPGPGGVVVFFVGLALLARELRPVARLLDWCEPKLRASWKRGKAGWRRASTVQQLGLVLLGMTLVAGFSYIGYAYLS